MRFKDRILWTQWYWDSYLKCILRAEHHSAFKDQFTNYICAGYQESLPGRRDMMDHVLALVASHSPHPQATRISYYCFCSAILRVQSWVCTGPGNVTICYKAFYTISSVSQAGARTRGGHQRMQPASTAMEESKFMPIKLGRLGRLGTRWGWDGGVSEYWGISHLGGRLAHGWAAGEQGGWVQDSACARS